ncbi:2-dehydropantoate 2-reductase [Sandaracinobacteroides hominis]|uniref:2-dehydropantoate 2-reductase n=1 Tax=Sandaracinobacteroides hominis TaxID=2780086 RepID=UPI0018F3EA52|nr:2-dehydropantoate 2-reductase [Sandaracinobacteroides hominis]
MSPRIAVFGAGMIGIFLGGQLAQTADVTLIGRPSMLDPLANGLRLTDSDGMDIDLPASAYATTADPSALSSADLILVTVKSMATPEAAAAIAAHAPPSTPIISFQNGVSNSDTLRAALPGRTVLAGMVPFNVAQRGPAHFHRGTGGGLVAEAAEALTQYEQTFATTGIDLKLSSNIIGIQWGKLLINLNNAINALSGISLARELGQRGYRTAWAMSMTEGMKLLATAGIEPVDPLPMPLKLMPSIMRLPDTLYRYVISAASGGKVRVDPHARSSMADDLERGRPTEIDYLQGEFVRLAQRLGKAAPVNARLVELVRAAEQGAPPLKAAALLAELRKA